MLRDFKAWNPVMHHLDRPWWQFKAPYKSKHLSICWRPDSQFNHTMRWITQLFFELEMGGKCFQSILDSILWTTTLRIYRCLCIKTKALAAHQPIYLPSNFAYPRKRMNTKDLIYASVTHLDTKSKATLYSPYQKSQQSHKENSPVSMRFMYLPYVLLSSKN